MSGDPASAAPVQRAARRAGQQEQRREHILAAALQVFARDGLEGATVRAIAAEAGYATGALYAYFDGKEEIYAELLSRSLNRLHKAMRQSVSNAASSASGRARAAALAFFSYYRQHPDELELGLYLSRGAAPRGLTAELDRELNGRLIGVLELIAQPLREHLGGPPDTANRATVRLAALIIGGLILDATGRLKVLGQHAETLVDDTLRDLLERRPQL